MSCKRRRKKSEFHLFIYLFIYLYIYLFIYVVIKTENGQTCPVTGWLGPMLQDCKSITQIISYNYFYLLFYLL